jgi:long-chain acyl-CoA synthetase
LEPELWKAEAKAQGFAVEEPSVFAEKAVQRWMLEKVVNRLKDFPGYAKVRSVCLSTTAWTIEDGTMTPTMKLRRKVILSKNQANIAKMYEGH